ncbi:MAG: hypothetical protein AAFN11_06525 [Chloroflexota bacterium]
MLPKTADDKTQEVITILNDDLAIRLWVQEVRDQNEVNDLPDKTREWVNQVDWLDDVQLDSVVWSEVVKFLLDNVS